MPFIPQTSGKFVPVEDESSQEPTKGEKVGALARGAVTSLVGGTGDLERWMLRKPLGEWIGQETPEKPFWGDRSGILPSSDEVSAGLSKLGWKEPSEEVSGYKTAGEIIGGFGTALPGIARGITRGVLGVGTDVTEALAKKAEALGFKLSPAQVERTESIAQKGATGWAEHNQNLANKLVTRGTGEESALVSKDFIAGRIDSLGKEFNKLYQGKDFQIDRDALDAIQRIAEAESAVPSVAGTSAVKQIANQILESNRSLMQATGGAGQKFSVTGEGLQKLRNALTQRARSSGRADAHEIYNLVDEIDASVARNHPEIAKELEILRPKYRNTVILEDAYRAGHIQGGDIDLQRMGEMLRGKQGSVRMAGMDIDSLGEIGRELKLSPITRSAGESTASKVRLGDTLRTTLGVVPSSLGLRSRAARAAQRAVSKEPSKVTKVLQKTRAPYAVAAGEVTKLADGEE